MGRCRSAWLRRLAGAAASLAVALAVPSAAQVPPGAPFAGLTVTAVHVEEHGQEVTEPGLVGLVETHVGQPLSLAGVRESIARLFGIGRFENVLVDAARDGAGVVLRYELVPLQSVVRVDFEGELGLPASRLRATLEDRFNGPPPLGRTPAAARALEDLYASFGYTRATVAPLPPRQEPRGLVLVFDVAAGPRAEVGAVTVVGTPRLSDAQLLDRLDVHSGGDYDRDRLDRALARYVSDLRGRGYYEATARHDAAVGADGRTIDLTIDVEAGPLVEVTFEGDPLPADRKKDLVPIAREGSVDEDLLEDSDRRIEQFLREQGYARARATHRRTQRDDRLDIAFTVRRGTQYRVEGVEITGNRAVPENDLRPLVRTAPGDPFVASRLGADVSAIELYYRRLGYAEVKVVSSVAEPPAAATPAATVFVTPRIVITEGPRTLVGRIDIEGSHAVASADVEAVIQSRPGAAVLGPPGPRRPRRRPPALSRPRLPVGVGPDAAALQRGPHVGGSRVHRGGGVAGHRRPHHRRGQHAHEHPHHPARTAAQARRPPRPERADREPAPPPGARPLPPRGHPRARPRRRAPRPARHRRGGAHHHDRLRRRSRGRPPAAAQQHGWAAAGAHRHRAARLLRDRPPQSLGQEPVDQPVQPVERPPERQRDRSLAQRPLQGVPRRRQLSRAARVRHQRRPARQRVPRAGRAHQLQLLPQGRHERALQGGQPAHAGRRALQLRLHQGLRRPADPARISCSSTGSSRRCACPPSPARSSATRATTRSTRRRAAC